MSVWETESEYGMEDRAKALLAHTILYKGFKVGPASSKTKYADSDLKITTCSIVFLFVWFAPVRLQHCKHPQKLWNLFGFFSALSLFLSVRMSSLLLFPMLVLKWKHLALSSIHLQCRWKESTQATVQLEHCPLKKESSLCGCVCTVYERKECVCISYISTLPLQQTFPLQTVTSSPFSSLSISV